MRAPKVPGIPGAPRPVKHNQANRNSKESRQREKLLDTSKANYFKYDLQDLLKASPVAPELHNSLIQTLWAKGTRDSTQEAKVWLNDKVKEKQVDVPTQQRILAILDRFSTWR